MTLVLFVSFLLLFQIHHLAGNCIGDSNYYTAAGVMTGSCGFSLNLLGKGAKKAALVDENSNKVGLAKAYPILFTVLQGKLSHQHSDIKGTLNILFR